MIIQQSAELNKYVDPTIPLTWSVRRRIYSLLLPLLIFSSVCISEIILYQLWAAEKPVIPELPRLAIGVLAPFLLLLLWEVAVRSGHRTERTLELLETGVVKRPFRIRWQWILSWKIEPIESNPDLVKLTIEWRDGKRGRLRTSSIALRSRDQLHELKSELELARQAGRNTAPLIELDSPSLTRERSSSRGMWAGLLAMYLFFHGFPLLCVGAFPDDADGRDTKTAWTPRREHQVGRLIARHFSSVAELRRFYVVVGGSLTVAAVGFGFWSFRVGRDGQDRREIGVAKEATVSRPM